MDPATQRTLAIVAILPLAIPFFSPFSQPLTISEVTVEEEPVAGEPVEVTVTLANTGEKNATLSEENRLLLEVDGERKAARSLLRRPNGEGPPKYLALPAETERNLNFELVEEVAGERRIEAKLTKGYLYGSEEKRGNLSAATETLFRNPEMEGFRIWLVDSGETLSLSVSMRGGDTYTGSLEVDIKGDEDSIYRNAYSIRGARGIRTELPVTGFTPGESYRGEVSFAGETSDFRFDYPAGDSPTGELLYPETTAVGDEVSDTDETQVFGLLPLWQRAYNGSGTHGYDFDGDGEGTVQQCGNCHMDEGGASKNPPPLHPIGRKSSDTGNWFVDDGRHRGPNAELTYQVSGIKPGVQCGDCHTATDPEEFGTPGAEATNDPHSVHRDVIGREGCIRCHVSDETVFAETPLSPGNRSFLQGNASSSTFGISNPVNMTRAWDGTFLSTNGEATYSGDTNSTDGSGWNVYGSPDGEDSSIYGCGDCHGQLHESRGMSFAFDSSGSSRKGPVARVEQDESPGAGSESQWFTCGECHVTDAHAVHTNGKVRSDVSIMEMTSGETELSNFTPEGSMGAELCVECHGGALAASEGGHYQPSAGRLLGLRPPIDGPPDAPGMNEEEGDCGFCHIGGNSEPGAGEQVALP